MKTLRIDFSDFYPGFNKNDNFFYNRLSKRFNLQICEAPDYLIYAHEGNHHRLHNCTKIFFNVESIAPDFTDCDYALTCHQLDDPRHYRLPYYAYEHPAAPLIRQPNEWESIQREKTKFCSFVVGNVHKKTRPRIRFFEKLNARRKVDSAGKALNNFGRIVSVHEKMDFLRPYRFTIAFENEAIPGYTTEKIYQAMRARCIPIYRGSSHIAEEFNPKSFLNYDDYPSEEALIDRIIEIDQSEELFAEFHKQPYFHHNVPNSCYDDERLLDFFERIFSTAIVPVRRKRYFFQFGRWIFVKRHRLRK